MTDKDHLKSLGEGLADVSVGADGHCADLGKAGLGDRQQGLRHHRSSCRNLAAGLF